MYLFLRIFGLSCLFSIEFVLTLVHIGYVFLSAVNETDYKANVQSMALHFAVAKFTLKSVDLFFVMHYFNTSPVIKQR